MTPGVPTLWRSSLSRLWTCLAGWLRAVESEPTAAAAAAALRVPPYGGGGGGGRSRLLPSGARSRPAAALNWHPHAPTIQEEGANQAAAGAHRCEVSQTKRRRGQLLWPAATGWPPQRHHERPSTRLVSQEASASATTLAKRPGPPKRAQGERGPTQPSRSKTAPRMAPGTCLGHGRGSCKRPGGGLEPQPLGSECVLQACKPARLLAALPGRSSRAAWFNWARGSAAAGAGTRGAPGPAAAGGQRRRPKEAVYTLMMDAHRIQRKIMHAHRPRPPPCPDAGSRVPSMRAQTAVALLLALALLAGGASAQTCRDDPACDGKACDNFDGPTCACATQVRCRAWTTPCMRHTVQDAPGPDDVPARRPLPAAGGRNMHRMHSGDLHRL